MAEREIAAQLDGQRLTVAEVIYYMPDHPALLQRFLWQTLDLPPEFPRVCQFLAFWRREIDAVIHSVTCQAVGLVAPARLDVRRDVGLLN
ncbi:MAG: protein usg [Caulobacteraceae bacterium]